MKRIQEEIINLVKANAEKSTLTMLQPIDESQLIQLSMAPNYEMALFIAQSTGSVIVTDSENQMD